MKIGASRKCCERNCDGCPILNIANGSPSLNGRNGSRVIEGEKCLCPEREEDLNVKTSHSGGPRTPSKHLRELLDMGEVTYVTGYQEIYSPLSRDDLYSD